ncbi:MAG TPA: TAXI family TRAP transporter solute-binding subunit [Xanthobacteraceae bacterium]|jgi:TRAP transporter TAXI family solute receptor
MRAKVASAVIVCVACLISIPASAQDSRPLKHTRADGQVANNLGYQVNKDTIGIISGNINGTYLRLAYDMAAVLDDEKKGVRVLPIIGAGGGGNIRDVRFLKGIDLGITQSVLLNRYKRTNEIGPIDDKIVYITKLNNEEMHVAVRADSGINSIEQLAGKKVNFSDVGSGSHLSSVEIFERLNIKAIQVNMGQADAFEAMKRGEIAASLLIAGKPTGSTRTLKAANGFKLLPVPYSKPLQDDFFPAVLTHEDYPDLIEKGQTVDTVAVVCVLIAYNWAKDTDRYQRISRFVEAFFPRIADFQKPPRHPKWKEANLTAVVPGWKRHDAAEEWIQKNLQPKTDAERKQFEEYLGAQRGRAQAFAPEQREQLFEEFLKWRQARERR